MHWHHGSQVKDCSSLASDLFLEIDSVSMQTQAFWPTCPGVCCPKGFCPPETLAQTTSILLLCSAINSGGCSASCQTCEASAASLAKHALLQLLRLRSQVTCRPLRLPTRPTSHSGSAMFQLGAIERLQALLEATEHLTGLLSMQDSRIIYLHFSPVHDLAEAACVRV